MDFERKREERIKEEKYYFFPKPNVTEETYG